MDGGGGGKDENPFPWFDEPPLSMVVEKIASLYGNKTTHSIINRLKLGKYTWRDETFLYRSDAEDAAIVLMSLLDEEVKVPIAFVDALLYKAHKGELCWRGDQYRRYCGMTGQKLSTSQKSGSYLDTLPKIPDGTMLIGISGQTYIVESDAIVAPIEISLDEIRLEQYNIAKRKDGFNCAGIPGLSEIHYALGTGKVRFADRDGGEE